MTGQPYKHHQPAPITADECFELGRHSYNNQDYYHTILWMQEARSQLQNEGNPLEMLRRKEAHILDYLSFAMSKVIVVYFIVVLYLKTMCTFSTDYYWVTLHGWYTTIWQKIIMILLWITVYIAGKNTSFHEKFSSFLNLFPVELLYDYNIIKSPQDSLVWRKTLYIVTKGKSWQGNFPMFNLLKDIDS